MPSDLNLNPELFARLMSGAAGAAIGNAMGNAMARARPMPFRTYLRAEGDEFTTARGVIRHIGITTPPFFQTAFALTEVTSGAPLYNGYTASGSQLLPSELPPGILQGDSVLQYASDGCDGVSVTSVSLPSPPLLGGKHVMAIVATTSSDPSNIIASLVSDGYAMASSTLLAPSLKLYVFLSSGSVPQTTNTGSSGTNDACSVIVFEMANAVIEATRSKHQIPTQPFPNPIPPTAQPFPFTLYAIASTVGPEFGYDQPPYTMVNAPLGGGAYASMTFASVGNQAPTPLTGVNAVLTLLTFVSFTPPANVGTLIGSDSSMQATSQTVFIPFTGGLRLVSYTGRPVSSTGSNQYPLIVCGDTVPV